jgi:hypothetical protein
MAITLNEWVFPTSYRGDDVAELSAGQHFKVETSPRGEELLDYTAPAGGATVRVYVEITLN